MRVSGVCSRWRTIAIGAPYLWTHINVYLDGPKRSQKRTITDKISTLLDRSGDLALDVEIYAHGDGVAASIRQFHSMAREKGYFNRWRTLCLDWDRNLVIESFHFSNLRDVDNFSRLECLTLISRPPPTYIYFISKSITSRIHTLVLGKGFWFSDDFHVEYGRILGQVRSVGVLGWNSLPPVALPPNVSSLYIWGLADAPIPHVKYLTVKDLDLKAFAFSNPNPIHIVALRIDMYVGRHFGFTTSLPNLRWLMLRQHSYIALELLKTPELHTLTFEDPDILEKQSVNGELLYRLKNDLLAPKLRMLSLDIPIDDRATDEVFRLFPKLSRIEIYQCDPWRAESFLYEVFGNRRNFNVCPNMTVIRLILKRPPYNSGHDLRCAMRKAAGNVGDCFAALECSWSGGGYYEYVGDKTRRDISCEDPWVHQGAIVRMPIGSYQG